MHVIRRSFLKSQARHRSKPISYNMQILQSVANNRWPKRQTSVPALSQILDKQDKTTNHLRKRITFLFRPLPWSVSTFARVVLQHYRQGPVDTSPPQVFSTRVS